MSLAHKLWKIGNVLQKDDIKKSLRVGAGFKDGDEPVYLNIDFTFDDDQLAKISLFKDSISKDKLFFTKKIGGTSNAYYLYPNIAIQNERPSKGIKNIKNTLEYSTIKFCDDENRKYIKIIMENFDEAVHNCSLDNYLKNNYIIWLSIQGKAFYEMMPEVWKNYYESPFPKTAIKSGFDIFTNKETEIGYKTDFKVYSYDQYHKSLEYRLDDNLPLSKESARNIKYAWMYILDNLVFYYKGLEYIIIPNLLMDNDEILRTVLRRFIRANTKLSGKRSILEKLKKEEKRLKNDLDKFRKKKRDTTESKNELKKIKTGISKTDLGIIQEFNEQALTLKEYVNTVTMDYLFVNLNRTNLSFEIIGTIEDVVPSRMSNIVDKMREYKVEDLVKLVEKVKEKTYLQDFFNRDEMELRATGVSLFKERSSNLRDYLVTERLFLAKLLLSDNKIKRSDLLNRFDYNRSFSYDKKKRLTKDGIQEWIQYPGSFVEKENTVMEFLQCLGKVQED